MVDSNDWQQKLVYGTGDHAAVWQPTTVARWNEPFMEQVSHKPTSKLALTVTLFPFLTNIANCKKNHELLKGRKEALYRRQQKASNHSTSFRLFCGIAFSENLNQYKTRSSNNIIRSIISAACSFCSVAIGIEVAKFVLFRKKVLF